MFIVLVGNVIDGTTFFGPFTTSEEASAWAERAEGHSDWHVTELVKPLESDELENSQS